MRLIKLRFPFRNRLPWRIFSRVILIQAFVILTLYGLTGIAVRFYFLGHFESQIRNGQLSLHSFHQALAIYDTTLVFFLAAMALVLTGFSVFLARRLVFPIGRMLIQAQSILNHEVQFEGFDQQTYGEWSDLETSIEAIRREMETKIESLNAEREEQATLMSAISDAIIAVDKEGSILFYNSRFALLLENQELRKRPRLWEMFREPEILGAFQAALIEGKVTSVHAIPIEQQNRNQFFSISISPLRQKKGSIYGAVGIFHDVTELKMAEQIRIDFVANVSHELRTPLTSIKGYVDTLIQDHSAGLPIDFSFLDALKRNTERLMDLIHDLLDLSALDSSEVIHKVELSTSEETYRVLEQMKKTFALKSQDVLTHIEVTTVCADSKRLEQVLVNLLDNAHKYTPEFGKIQITWQKNSASNILLKVQDNGPGIPPEHHARLFERFYRVDKARSREKGGTGLGLAIVKHILQKHGGSARVESSTGSGATFICEFPGV